MTPATASRVGGGRSSTGRGRRLRSCPRASPRRPAVAPTPQRFAAQPSGLQRDGPVHVRARDEITARFEQDVQAITPIERMRTGRWSGNGRASSRARQGRLKRSTSAAQLAGPPAPRRWYHERQRAFSSDHEQATGATLSTSPHWEQKPCARCFCRTVSRSRPDASSPGGDAHAQSRPARRERADARRRRPHAGDRAAHPGLARVRRAAHAARERPAQRLRIPGWSPSSPMRAWVARRPLASTRTVFPFKGSIRATSASISTQLRRSPRS